MFLDNLKTIALQVFILYLMAGVGFVTDKIGLFKQSDGKRLIDLIFNVVLPIAIINTFIKMEYTPSHVKGLVVAFVCALQLIFSVHLFRCSLLRNKMLIFAEFIIMQPFFQMRVFLLCRLHKV